jgi:ABC-2 type transport system permease protein
MRRIRASAAFSAVVLRQLGRDRTALFFMLALPVAIIVIIGSTFGGQSRLRVGLVGAEGQVFQRLDQALDRADGVELERYDDVDELRRAVRRFTVAAGVVVPADADTLLATTGRVDVALLVLPTSDEVVTARRTLGGIVDDVASPLGAATFAAGRTGVGLDAALAAADDLVRSGGGGSISVTAVDVGDRGGGEIGQFSRTAPQNLVLFTFITALTSATLLVKARRTGILRRALASPTSLGVQLAGLAGGWFVICLLQSLLIVLVGAVGFGVSWGDPLAAAALIVVFALLGCGAGLLVGSLGANEDRVGAITPIVGMVLGALGGCMVPLEVFPDSMLTLAKVVPHYWAVDAWESLIYDGSGIGDIAANLAALAAIAVALLAVATLTMRSALTAAR